MTSRRSFLAAAAVLPLAGLTAAIVAERPTPVPTDIPPGDLEFLAARRIGTDRVLRAYRLPPDLLRS